MNFPQDHDEHLCEFVSDLKIDQAFIFRCQLICKCNKKKKGLSPKIDYYNIFLSTVLIIPRGYIFRYYIYQDKLKIVYQKINLKYIYR